MMKTCPWAHAGSYPPPPHPCKLSKLHLLSILVARQATELSILLREAASLVPLRVARSQGGRQRAGTNCRRAVNSESVGSCWGEMEGEVAVRGKGRGEWSGREWNVLKRRGQGGWGEIAPRHALPLGISGSGAHPGQTSPQKNTVGWHSRTDVKATAEKRETHNILIDHIGKPAQPREGRGKRATGSNVGKRAGARERRAAAEAEGSSGT